MIYKKIGDFIHLLLQPLNRKQSALEFIYTSGGSWFENKNDRGKKHLLEHCIVARTKDMDFQAFQDYQFAQNISVNAYTAPLTMGLSFFGHYSDTLTMLDLMDEVAFSPTFDQKILDQEKEIVLREIAERSGEPSYRLHFANMNKIFKKNSYNNHQVLGDSDLVSQTTISDFEKLLAENLSTSHLIINVAGGGFEAQQIEDKVNQMVSGAKFKQIIDFKAKHTIDYHPGSEFNEFSFLPIVNKLAHDHNEITIYIPCQISFANKPFLDIFEDLFLKYHGVLYDNLRNKLGLIYSMGSSFEISQQMLVINFATELKNTHKCLEVVEETFSDFEKMFNLKRFHELRSVLTKKTEMSSDTLTSNLYFSQNSLLDFGVFEDLHGFLNRLNATTASDIKSIYDQIQGNFKNKKIVIVSKNKEIENLKFD